jgi:5-oxoprolinase (ATP-hydrolysing)
VGGSGYKGVLREGGTRIDLAGTGRVEMAEGDVFVIETPGGGGFGRAGESREAAE